jgi:Winged helix-turn-helix
MLQIKEEQLTKIMYFAFLSYGQLNEYLSILIENNLIEYLAETNFYLLSFEINMYNIAIISNLPIIILKDRINLDIESRSMVVIPTVRPLLEIVDAVSNIVSIKLLFSVLR